MSSTIDPAKLKVVELRSELTARGLDTKGNKAVLVKRLKDALEKELQQEIPDTSIADTSTEELNTSQESIVEVEESSPPKEELVIKKDEVSTSEDVEMKESSATEPAEAEEPTEDNEEDKQEVSENGESTTEVENPQEIKKEKQKEEVEPEKTTEVNEKTDVKKEQRGEKRARSPSPGNAPPKRARSPVKEDEPQIDNDKVQLSWYDCDLHLDIDKHTFLSAKPYHEGVFGYAWAGARTTHGIASGKARFEVKIVERLKWEEIIKPLTKKEIARRSQKNTHNKKEETKKDEEEKKKDGEEKKKEEEKEKKEDESEVNKNGNQPSGDSEKMETEEDESTDKEEKKEESDNTVKKEEPETKTEEKEEVKKVEEEEEEQDKGSKDTIEPLVTHLIRVGWSLVDSGLQLGESTHSYAYESSGKFVMNGEFLNDFGSEAQVGDVIGAYIDISEDSVGFVFTINGELQPVAKSVPKSEFPPENFSLFPHVLTKNYSFEINVGNREEPWYTNPDELEDYRFVNELETKVPGPTRPTKREDCEVVMMCGLPASGKTTWARQWITDHPDKRYTLIGNSHLLERMTINGEPLKGRYQGRWHAVMDKIVRCMSSIIKRASLRRRNYILDQTNILPSAQRDKMRLFEGFKRRAVIVIVTDEEQTKREAEQEAHGGNDLPEQAVLEMKAMMGLPKSCDWLNEIKYVGLNEEESRAMVQKYNKQGRDAGFKPFPDRKDRFPLNKWDHNSSRRFQGSYNRNYGYNRGPWNNRRPPSGSWNQDVRNRGPPGRDWGRQQNRNIRDNRSSGSGSGSGGGYNRNPRSGSSGGGSSWHGSGGSSSSWQGQGGGGSWNNQGGQSWGSGGGGGGGGASSNWSGSGQNQWKGGSYGQNYSQDYGQGYNNYGNWDYYRQGYDQGWNSQGSQYPVSGGYGESYGQYQNNSWPHQGHSGGKYNRK